MLHTRYPALWLASGACALLLLLGGCGASPSATGSPTSPPATSQPDTPAGATPSPAGDEPAPDALAGSEWQLTALEQGGSERPLVASQPPTLKFADDGTLGGTTGCNSFGGNYRSDGQSLTVSELHQTLIGCDPPLAQQESLYIAALSTAQTYAIEGATLTITAADATLRFTRTNA
jgi:heat shock protein HslJ